MNKIEKLIEQLDLQPHPEGGFFKETYRSKESIQPGGHYGGPRNFSTCIYFLLTSDMFSAFHRIRQDEIWHFYVGSSIELHTISEEGMHNKFLIGPDIPIQLPQLIVPENHWFAAKVMQKDSYSLVGCTVSPGFDFTDFELAKRDEMLVSFPQHEELIMQFTR